jgi:putative FmdB family regulatory protein
VQGAFCVPIYEYQCDDCEASFEVMQKMSDDPLEVCERCGGRLRKVLHPVAIHFKGSGFYTTDYGRGSGRGAGAREGAGADGESPSREQSSAGEPPVKPAKSAGDGKQKESKAAT